MVAKRIMKNYPINQVYIYKSERPFTELSVRSYDNYSYLEGGIIHSAMQKGEIIHRYAKTYKDVTALLLTRDNNTERVEKFLDSVEYPKYDGTTPLNIEVKYA